MDGNVPVVRMEKLSCMPLETSLLTLLVAVRNTTLPVAPATESSASTSGTPAAKVVDKVRAKRATDDLYRMSPTTGTFSISLSNQLRNFSERVCACLKAKAAPTSPASTTYHQACSASDRPITIIVKAGNSAPKLANTSWNCGTTLIRRMAVTITATKTTAIG